MNDKNGIWEPLIWSQWRDTAMTVHLFTQIIGKVRLALMPMQHEWAQVPFQVTSRGLASIGMPVPGGSIDILFDFIDHKIIFNKSSGTTASFPLQNRSVKNFYEEVMKTLKEMNVDVEINPMSVEMQVPVKMDEDEKNNSYDKKFVSRWWHLLVLISNIFNKFKSRFFGKETPVNFFWGSFDLSITFFSGKIIPPKPEFDLIYRVAMDAEQITIGFWPGSDDYTEASFFAYIYPKPDGYENELISPSSAKWSTVKGEFMLPYESIRSGDPEKSIMEFCETAYNAAIKLAKWDLKTIEHKPPLKKQKV